jgi:hypothetical protein
MVGEVAAVAAGICLPGVTVYATEGTPRRRPSGFAADVWDTDERSDS